MTGIVTGLGIKALAGRALGSAASGAKGVASAGKRFFSALNPQGWAGLIVSLVLAFVAFHQWGEARHWKKQSAQFEKLYRADEASFQHIAKQATDLKMKIDALGLQISSAIKERFHEETAHNAAAADALRVSGPGKATCPGNPGPASPAGGHGTPTAAANAAVDQMPDRTGAVLIAMPFDDALSFGQSHDDLLAEVKAWRDDDAALRKAWPKSTKE